MLVAVTGDRPQRSELKRTARAFEIEDRVHALGFTDRDQVHLQMTDIDVYALPSRWKGPSNAAVNKLAIRNG